LLERGCLSEVPRRVPEPGRLMGSAGPDSQRVDPCRAGSTPYIPVIVTVGTRAVLRAAGVR